MAISPLTARSIGGVPTLMTPTSFLGGIPSLRSPTPQPSLVPTQPAAPAPNTFMGMALPDPTTYGWDIPNITDLQFAANKGSDPLSAAKEAFARSGFTHWGANAWDIAPYLNNLQLFAERFRNTPGVLSPNQLAMKRMNELVGPIPMGEATMQRFQQYGYGLGGAPDLYNEIMNQWFNQAGVKEALGADWDTAKNALGIGADLRKQLSDPRIQQAFGLQDAAKAAKGSFLDQYGVPIALAALAAIAGPGILAAIGGEGLAGVGAAALEAETLAAAGLTASEMAALGVSPAAIAGGAAGVGSLLQNALVPQIGGAATNLLSGLPTPNPTGGGGGAAPGAASQGAAALEAEGLLAQGLTPAEMATLGVTPEAIAAGQAGAGTAAQNALVPQIGGAAANAAVNAAGQAAAGATPPPATGGATGAGGAAGGAANQTMEQQISKALLDLGIPKEIVDVLGGVGGLLSNPIIKDLLGAGLGYLNSNELAKSVGESGKLQYQLGQQTLAQEKELFNKLLADQQAKEARTRGDIEGIFSNPQLNIDAMSKDVYGKMATLAGDQQQRDVARFIDTLRGKGILTSTVGSDYSKMFGDTIRDEQLDRELRALSFAQNQLNQERGMRIQGAGVVAGVPVTIPNTVNFQAGLEGAKQLADSNTLKAQTTATFFNNIIEKMFPSTFRTPMATGLFNR